MKRASVMWALAAGVLLSPYPIHLMGQEADSDDLYGARVIHRFDFDERDEGNLEELPKYWLPLQISGFPKYAVGRFDLSVGHDVPPSFYLDSSGRNVAYYYAGPDTVVRERSIHRIGAFIKPDQLFRARACLSAHFIDRTGRALPETMVRSRFVGGESQDGWTQIELFLPAAPQEVASIGLAAWVLQESTWDTRQMPDRYILKRDVHGGAWFDDITMEALPRVELRTSQPGNVLTADFPQYLEVILSHHDDTSLFGELEIWTADDELMSVDHVPALTTGKGKPLHVSLEAFPPGYYRAVLSVFSRGQPYSSHDIHFLRLADHPQRKHARARFLGVALEEYGGTDYSEDGGSDDEGSDGGSKYNGNSIGGLNDGESGDTGFLDYKDTDFLDYNVVKELLTRLSVGTVSMPVDIESTSGPQARARYRAKGRFLQYLHQQGISLVGVFSRTSETDYMGMSQHVRTLVELLADAPDGWEDTLGPVITPFATIFDRWQMGSNHNYPLPEAGRLLKVVSRMRQAMSRYVTTPLLAIPVWSAEALPATSVPGGRVSITFDSETPYTLIESRLREIRQEPFTSVSAYLQGLPVPGFPRLARMEFLAKRVLTARHAGADEVLVPQPWVERKSLEGTFLEPLEEYIVLRTLALTIDDSEPGGRLPVAPGVEALVFHHGESSIIALWDPLASDDGRKVLLQLGQNSYAIDLWGNPIELKPNSDGLYEVSISTMPILIGNVDRWIVELCQSLKLTPSQIESGTEIVEHTLELQNPSTSVQFGEIKLMVPDSWEITPKSLAFSLSPQRMARLPLQIRYPHNETAGKRAILANIQLQPESLIFQVPLAIDIGWSQVDVRSLVVVENGDLLLWHIITGRSSTPLDLRSSAEVPGYERQYRPLADLEQDQTQVVQYRYANAESISGKTVRLTLRPMGRGTKTHTLELKVP